jgi:hypothetical protein
MEMNSLRRRPRQLLLDGLFVAMMVHFLVTGYVVPQALVELFRDQPQVVVSVEPELVPETLPEEAPIIDDGDLLPETQSGLRSHEIV